MINVINYDLFIFDLDDTIIKTEKYHHEAWNIVLKKFINNYYIDYNNYCNIFHSKYKNNINNYIVNILKLNNYDELIILKQNTYLNILKENINNIYLIDGLEKFLNFIIDNNKEFIIVSNTSRINIEFIFELDRCNILKKCKKYYYGEMYKNKKPDPECYIQVVRDFPNVRYIAFEDSITGIEALSHVKDIKTIFINNKDYIHYEYIMKNYKNIENIIDYALIL